MTINLLLRTAEAPSVRRRAGKLAPLLLWLGACAAAGGCTSGTAWANPDKAPRDAQAARGQDGGVRQASLETSQPGDDASLRPVPKQDPSEPSPLRDVSMTKW